MSEKMSQSSPIEKTFEFTQENTREKVRFICSLNENIVGSVTLSQSGRDTYTIGGLFVESSKRGQGIASNLIKKVNSFLKEHNAEGKLVNMIQGDSASLYENNGWKKGEYKSHGAYGGYEYTYNAKLGG